jgi:cobalt/nickel transport system permease protein
VVGTAIGLKRLDYERIAQAGILAATFFVASLIHIPVGPSSVHLLLNGIVGLLLGWAAFPVIMVGLTLQAMLFQFGGITVLGVNTLNVAAPAVLCGFLLRRSVAGNSVMATVAAFACGALAVFLTALMVAGSLLFSQESFFAVASLVVAAHLPVMVIEGLVTAFCVAFLKKVQPESLSSSFAGPTPLIKEASHV